MTPKRILVVEDNPVNLELCSALLERGGHTVVVASTAEQAMRRAQLELPDLILMDVGLPDGDGLSVATRLKNAVPTQSIPIVALTAHAMAEDEQKALTAGCDAYIAKPIDTRTFLSRLEHLLTKAR